jgi:putative transposase
MTVRNQIQHVALCWPGYGYRRVHAELVRQGWKINHKRVLRLMRSDNLLCVRRRKFIFTTDSRHGLPIHPNLVAGLVVTSIDQLWVADITYIRLQREFVYLAVLLDAFSRRCLGWALRRSLEAALALEALHMALRQRRPKPGLVHHSDRGVQYASQDYAAELACLRFAGRERFCKTKPRRTMIFQRTATTPLTSCLSPRVQSLLPSVYTTPLYH